MKPILVSLIVLSLLPQLSRAQQLPNAPQPSTLDPAWERVRNLPAGQQLVVVVENAPPVHCVFSQATDAYLFCDPTGNPAGVGYRISRADVISVDFDLPSFAQAQCPPHHANWHPGLLATAAIAGTVVGAASAARYGNAGVGAWTGLFAAGFVEAIGYRIVDMQNQGPRFGWVFPLPGMSGLRPLRVRPLPRQIPWLPRAR